MDEGDEYVPQISQMNYNLMNDVSAGNSTFYDQQQQQTPSLNSMQMYGSSGVPQGTTPSVSNMPQQRYANYHRQQQQQMISGGSQPNLISPVSQQQLQQRFFMQQQNQMQPGVMLQHSMQLPMFSSPINVPSVVDMNSMPNVSINKMPLHPLQSTSQPPSSVSTPLNTPAKAKSTRKSKKAVAAAVATAESASTSNSNNPNVMDPRGNYFLIINGLLFYGVKIQFHELLI